MSSLVLDKQVDGADDAEPATIGEQPVVWVFADFEAEYASLRSSCGLIDLSASGPIRLSGPGAVEVLQAALARDVEFLVPDRAMTSLMLRADGSIIDVVTVIAGESDYLLLTGPGQAREVETALRAVADSAGGPVQIDNDEQHTAIFALEGPTSWSVVAAVLGEDYVTLGYENSLPVEINGAEATIARIGVTGEYGYTFIAPIPIAAQLWTQFIASGARPAGHRARETAMLEVRQPIIHRELVAGDTVVTAGLNWLVELSKEDYVGRAALVAARDGSTVRTIGFRVDHAGTVAIGDELLVGSTRVGVICHLAESPGLGAMLGLARVDEQWQAARVDFTTPSGAAVTTLAPPYIVPTSWSVAIKA